MTIKKKEQILEPYRFVAELVRGKRAVLAAYAANEKKNAHSENLLLLANLYGNEKEETEARRQAESKRNADAKDYKMPNDIARSICDYYYEHLSVYRFHERLEERAVFVES